MTPTDYIQTTLVNLTNAMTASSEAKNNRWHYRLVFDEIIGWDWIEEQIKKASENVEPTLEPYKLGPAQSFIVVEVREVERREGIDNDQNSLDKFSQ